MSQIEPVRNILPKMSKQLRSVIAIVTADQDLMKTLVPYIDFNTEAIEWEDIFKIPLTTEEAFAVSVAHRIWSDEVSSNFNFFEAALNLSPELQAGILRALALRWGFKT